MAVKAVFVHRRHQDFFAAAIKEGGQNGRFPKLIKETTWWFS